ncbi:hypothetical protein [Nocardiopsis deserti]|uniref:hypothetical protein n=1 Tax=Nocardiopsis deserti TaxID=2605988 RepID=UPI00123AB968|nr:hypothetical protein [Nocardiopsis deserti]
MTELDRILSTIEDTGFIARDTRDGAIVSRAIVYAVGGTRVVLTSWDGISRDYEATACRTLAEQLTGYRQATGEEVAEFERLEARHPAPQNWD